MSHRFHRAHPFIGLALFLAAAGAHAQEAAPPALSLGSVLERAVQQNPVLLAQGYGERAAEAWVEQAGLRPNPTLGVSLENFAGTGALRGTDGLETTVQASQTFERGGKRAKRVSLAGREREAIAKEFAVHRAEILSASASAYIEMLAAQQRLALASESLGLAHETVAAVDARVKAAVASPAESARSRAALASVQADQARAQTGLANARAALAATWGGTPADVPGIVGTLQIPAAPPSEETFLARLAAHPRLGLQQARIAGRRAALELERSQAAQDVTVGGGVRFIRQGSDVAVVASVSVPIPFRNQNQGNIRAARENLAGAEQSGRAVEIELRVGFATAWRDLTAAHAAAQSLRREALPATEEAYAAVRSAYGQGRLPFIDVLDAQRSLVALRRELLDAEAAYAAALARAEALTDTSFAMLTALITRS